MPHSRNFYKMTVFTGLRRWSGTKSNIFFILTGDCGDTGEAALNDKRNRVVNMMFFGAACLANSINRILVVCCHLTDRTIAQIVC